MFCYGFSIYSPVFFFHYKFIVLGSIIMLLIFSLCYLCINIYFKRSEMSVLHDKYQVVQSSPSHLHIGHFCLQVAVNHQS